MGKAIPKLTEMLQANGSAKYCDDEPPARGGVCASFVSVRAPTGTLTAIDTSTALKMPGVCGFVSADDVPPDGNDVHGEPLFVGAGEEVGYNGQAIGIILADTQVCACVSE